MKTTEQRIEQVQRRNVSGAIRVRSAEGRGVSGTASTTDDARRLAAEAAHRALKITGRLSTHAPS